MARCSKKQKRAVILRRKRILKSFFFSFEKSSFLVKTMLWNKIQKLGSFLCFVGVFEADWEAILLAWVTCQRNDDLLLSSRM